MRYGAFGHVLSIVKGCDERAYGLSGTPVVIIHGHQRHVLAEMEQGQAVEPA